jgi:hypothetical protein
MACKCSSDERSRKRIIERQTVRILILLNWLEIGFSFRLTCKLDRVPYETRSNTEDPDIVTCEMSSYTEAADSSV